MKNALEIEKLYGRRGSFWLKDVNLVIEEEKIHAVTGKSGSGKSTLIRAVGGAVRPEAGCIRYEYYRSARNEDELLLVEKWESEGHQAEHVKQPHMAELRELKEQYVVSTHVEKSFCI